MFHRTNTDQVHPRLKDGAIRLLDGETLDSTPAKITGERQPHGSLPDDKDGNVILAIGVAHR
jgi:hypothetical protein